LGLTGIAALAVLAARSNRIVIVGVEIDENTTVNSLARVAISRFDAGEEEPL
jgi:hypothetical protein